MIPRQGPGEEGAICLLCAHPWFHVQLESVYVNGLIAPTHTGSNGSNSAVGCFPVDSRTFISSAADCLAPFLQKRNRPLPVHGRSSALQQSVRRARLKQLRGLRSGRGQGWASGSSTPKAPHSCLECHFSFRDCDALLIHRIRHIKGKHWPCPVRVP